MDKQTVKLTLTLETAEGKTVERKIEGAAKIFVILDEAGILDAELEEALREN